MLILRKIVRDFTLHTSTFIAGSGENNLDRVVSVSLWTTPPPASGKSQFAKSLSLPRRQRAEEARSNHRLRVHSMCMCVCARVCVWGERRVRPHLGI